jgi:Ca2+-transporting ATPase
MENLESLDRNILSSLNEPQEKAKNKENLDKLGGIELFCKKYFSSDSNNANYFQSGLSDSEVDFFVKLFGDNEFPETPLKSFFTILLEVLSDPILLILLAAAAVSLIVGLIEDPVNGYTEGIAIFVAVILVSMIGAGNDYSKQLQFRELEKSTANDELASVLRNGKVERINPKYICIGDILVLQVSSFIYIFYNFCLLYNHHCRLEIKFPQIA